MRASNTYYLDDASLVVMRRLILEIARKEIGRIEKRDLVQNVRSIEILHFLRQDRDEISMICRIELRDRNASIVEALSHNDHVSAQILEHEGSGAYIVFAKGRPGEAPRGVSVVEASGAYLVASEMDDEKIRRIYIGDRSQLMKTLKSLERAGVRFRVISLTDAKFSPGSPLNALTEKQKSVLTAAFRLGYYDIPRRINSEQLARKLDIHSSALIAH
jgi:hypothetical protein